LHVSFLCTFILHSFSIVSLLFSNFCLTSSFRLASFYFFHPSFVSLLCFVFCLMRLCMKGFLFWIKRKCGKIEKEFVTLHYLDKSLSFFLFLVIPFGQWCSSIKYDPCISKSLYGTMISISVMETSFLHSGLYVLVFPRWSNQVKKDKGKI